MVAQGSAREAQAIGATRPGVLRPLSATGRVGNAASALAIGKAIGRVAGPIGVAMTLGSILDLAAEMYWRQDQVTGQWQKLDTSGGYCAIGPCYEYHAGAFAGPNMDWQKTRTAACDNAFAEVKGRNSAWIWEQLPMIRVSGPGPLPGNDWGSCQFRFSTNGGSTWNATGASLDGRRAERIRAMRPTLISRIRTLLMRLRRSLDGRRRARLPGRRLTLLSTTGLAAGDEHRCLGPATSPGPEPKVKTEKNPDGSTKTTTTTTTHNHTYNGDKITTTTVTVTNITNNGEQGKTDTTTESETPKPEEEPKITCGLPDTPACKIDETGTAEKVDAEDPFRKTYDGIKDIVADPAAKLPKLPTVNWTFALPSACGDIPLPGFAHGDLHRYLPLPADVSRHHGVGVDPRRLVRRDRSSCACAAD